MNEAPQITQTYRGNRLNKISSDAIVFFPLFIYSLALAIFLKISTVPLGVFVSLSSYPLLLLINIVFLTLAFATLKNVVKQKHSAVLAGIIISLILFSPFLIITIQALTQGGLTGEGFAIIPFTLIALAPILLWGVVIGIIQEWIVQKWNTMQHRNKQRIKTVVFATLVPILAWLTIFFGRTGQAIAVGCPEFSTNIRSLALGSDNCISKAAIIQQNPGVCKLILARYNRDICETKAANTIINFAVPELGIRFQYPSNWGKANFEEHKGTSGKKFSINFCCYDSLQELEEMSISIGGATEELEKAIFGSSGVEFYDFDENTCRLLAAKAYINAINRPAFDCGDLIGNWQTPVGDVFYYRKSNEGTGIIRLSNSDYKIMTARKRINAPEKEVEFTNFLRSLDKL